MNDTDRRTLSIYPLSFCTRENAGRIIAYPPFRLTMSTIPGGAACYFCLGEEADEEGKPLVRNCSCRGDSAGFAHLSCLTKYSEQKCKRADDGDTVAFSNPWRFCNNCKQLFQGQLSIDMASVFFSFVEATYGHPDSSKWDKIKIIVALRSKIMALSDMHGTDTTNEAVKVEMTLLTNQLLDTIKQTKKDLNMSRWIHKPKGSVEYQYYKMMCGNYEAFAHQHLGAMLMLDTSEEGFKVMVTHYKKASAICNLVGMKDRADHLDTMISVCTVNKQAANDEDAFSTVTSLMMQKMSEIYKLNLHTKGMDSEDTIPSGVLYAKQLRVANHCIEAERLITKLATISRRVHGPNHKITIEADELLKEIKERYIYVFPDNKSFQVLRYENDGEICVVSGPITEPRNSADERMYHIANNCVIPRKGCPVICRGLVSAPHLNGELGEVRDSKFDEKTGITRLAVHFEKKGMQSALVKAENLHIAFELPSKSNA